VINLDLNEAFKILEIDLTTNKKTIKAAYSRILKKYHPEEFPDLFIQINEAYKKTLEEVSKFRPEHLDFLETYYKSGKFIVSGSLSKCTI